MIGTPFLLALPLLAVGREIVVFLRERIALGTWPVPMPATALVGVGTAEAAAAAGSAQPATTEGAPSGGAVGVGTRMRASITRWRSRRGGGPGTGGDS